MADSGFRVQAVEIEGFKGFTTRKEIDFRGRHAFLLGQNGKGKSSIIEAIRWGLFGSTGRPNETVANQRYSEVCRVVITLMREGKKWNLQRTLLRGTGGGSEAKLTDEQGQRHFIGKIMPQLAFVDAGEGTHIILAPQSTSLRRQPEDLAPFEKTVFDYLELTSPRLLLSQVESFIEDQHSVEESLGQQITDIRDNINNRITEFKGKRGNILRSPPWGRNRPPSVAQSENEARDLIKEITRGPSDESLLGVSLDALIADAEDALNNRRDQDQSGLKTELAENIKRRDGLKALRDIQGKVETLQNEINNIQSRLKDTLEGVSLDEARKNFDEARSAADADALRRQIVENAISLLRRDQAESAHCPVCEEEHQRQDLDATLQRTVSQLAGNITLGLIQQENRLKQAEELNRQAKLYRSKLKELKQNANTARMRIAQGNAQELPEQVSTEHLDKMIDRCLKCEASIEEQINGQEDGLATLEARLSKLRDEENFHRLQDELKRLEKSRNQLGKVQNAYNGLVSFGESVQAIKEAIQTCLIGQLKEGIPKVSKNLSKAFAALTHHPWFDRLTLAENKLPKFDLKVESSQDDSGRRHPTGVLNGQAESALALVPYFAFSQADDTPTEVYLILLDDPTRAFDEEHTKILIECLAELGHRVQIMVASQETVRFRELLPKKFEPDSYVVVEPTQWSYQDGPDLKIDY